MALKKEQIIVRISPRQKQQFEKIAKSKEMTMSELLRLKIEEMINEENGRNQ